MFLTKKGKILRVPVSDIPKVSLLDKDGNQVSRKPVGVKAITLDKNDYVVDLATTCECEDPK